MTTSSRLAVTYIPPHPVDSTRWKNPSRLDAVTCRAVIARYGHRYSLNLINSTNSTNTIIARSTHILRDLISDPYCTRIDMDWIEKLIENPTDLEKAAAAAGVPAHKEGSASAVAVPRPNPLTVQGRVKVPNKPPPQQTTVPEYTGSITNPKLLKVLQRSKNHNHFFAEVKAGNATAIHVRQIFKAWRYEHGTAAQPNGGQQYADYAVFRADQLEGAGLSADSKEEAEGDNGQVEETEEVDEVEETEEVEEVDEVEETEEVEDSDPEAEWLPEESGPVRRSARTSPIPDTESVEKTAMTTWWCAVLSGTIALPNAQWNTQQWYPIELLYLSFWDYHATDSAIMRRFNNVHRFTKSLNETLGHGDVKKVRATTLQARGFEIDRLATDRPRCRILPSKEEIVKAYGLDGVSEVRVGQDSVKPNETVPENKKNAPKPRLQFTRWSLDGHMFGRHFRRRLPSRNAEPSGTPQSEGKYFSPFAKVNVRAVEPSGEPGVVQSVIMEPSGEPGVVQSVIMEPSGDPEVAVPSTRPAKSIEALTDSVQTPDQEFHLDIMNAVSSIVKKRTAEQQVRLKRERELLELERAEVEAEREKHARHQRAIEERIRRQVETESSGGRSSTEEVERLKKQLGEVERLKKHLEEEVEQLKKEVAVLKDVGMSYLDRADDNSNIEILKKDKAEKEQLLADLNEQLKDQISKNASTMTQLQQERTLRTTTAKERDLERTEKVSAQNQSETLLKGLNDERLARNQDRAELRLARSTLETTTAQLNSELLKTEALQARIVQLSAQPPANTRAPLSFQRASNAFARSVVSQMQPEKESVGGTIASTLVQLGKASA